jgi:hypothetical protein
LSAPRATPVELARSSFLPSVPIEKSKEKTMSQNPSLSDAKRRWSALTLPDRLGVIAGVVCFIASFLPWYRVSFQVKGFDGGSSSTSAWNVGFGGWFPVLLLLALAAAIIVRSVGVQLPPQGATAIRLGQVIAPPVAAAVILIRWLSYPGGSSLYGSAGAGFGLFIGLAAAIVGCLGALTVFRASKPQ